MLEHASNSFNPNEGAHPITEELLISMIVIGDVEFGDFILDLLNKLDRKVLDEFNIEIEDEEELAVNFLEGQLINELEDAGETEIDYNRVREQADKGYIEIKEGDVGRYQKLLDFLKQRINPNYDELALRYNNTGLKDIHFAICEGVKLANFQRNKDKSIPLLCKTIGVNSSGSLSRYVEIFQQLGADKSFPFLLENLKSDNELLRRMSAEILYELESREKTVDNPEGVEYFRKMYVLIKDEDPDFFVRMYEKRAKVLRLSREKISVIDETGIVGYFQLDVESKESKLVAKVHELKTKDVFLPKADKDDELLRKILMEKFLENYIEVQKEITEKTGVELNALELHEQGWFVTFWSGEATTPNEKDRVARLAKEYGTDGVKAFLALDYGESADEVMNFMESGAISESDKKTILHSYAQLLDRSMEWRKTFDVIEEGQDFNFSAEAHEAIIRKSTEFLREAILIRDDELQRGKLAELNTRLNTLSEAFHILRGIYDENGMLEVVRTEYNPGFVLDVDSTIKEKFDSSKTWILNDRSGAKIVVTVRPERTFNPDGSPQSEARIGFNITLSDGRKVRLAFDHDTYYTKLPLDHPQHSEEPLISMDVGFDISDFLNKAYSTGVTKRLLAEVPNTEGGHTYKPFSKEVSCHHKEISISFCDYLSSRFGEKLSWKQKRKLANRL